MAVRVPARVNVRGCGSPAGEVDLSGYAQLQTALGRVDLVPAGGSVTLDARDLSFIDHRGLIQLVEHVRGRGASTALQVGPSSAVPMLAGLLRLPDLEMVVS